MSLWDSVSISVGLQKIRTSSYIPFASTIVSNVDFDSCSSDWDSYVNYMPVEKI